MAESWQLEEILERILNHTANEDDIAQLRQFITSNSDRNTVQIGKYNVNIAEGKDIHIGDKIYQGADAETIRAILLEIRSQNTQPIEINWHDIGQTMLSEELRLTTNPLTSGEGISYRTEQVYVPLGLVEPKKPTRRREDVAPEQGSELYRETEITQTFEHQEFLEGVLQQRQSPKSQGKRIAIIGEPGAGKTTLLQQIARWVSEEILDTVVIWVSLADLRGRELEAYLFEVWLQAVARKVGQAEASTQIKDDFVAQFNQGLVWLLLDGVDEMQATVNPLAEINRQLRTGSLLQQARIVLSCRLNLWDGGTNALDSFDNYRTLEFSYPQQVEQFIDNWFGSLPSAEIQIGQRLCAALAETGKERIRDLAKNPLRLTLLCFNWYLGEGKLPETKAGLYEQFVADFYEWKKEQFTTTGEQRKRLNSALGELAREAIDKEATRFRLRQEFVCEYLGEPDDADSLFGLALQLGWLNKVGVDGDNPRKGVYAFFHPTFQEYFAAKDLLKLLPTFNSTQLRQNYLNLLKWTEIIALMLGFSEVAEQEAIEFIKQALDVDLMLGARLAGEVRNNFHEQTVKLILKLNVSQKLKFYFLGLTGSAKAVKPLQEAWNNKNHENAYIIAEALEKLGDDEAINTINKWEDEHISALNEIAKYEEESNYWLCDSIVSGLEKIVASNTGILELVISLTDKKLVSRKGSEYYLQGRNYQAKKVLGERVFHQAILFLLQSLKHQDFRIRYHAALALGNIGSEKEVTALLKSILDENYFVRSSVIEALGKLESIKSVNALIQALTNDKQPFVCSRAAEALGTIGSDIAIPALIQQLKHKKFFVRLKVVEALGKIGGEESIYGLIEALKDDEKDVRFIAIKALGEKGTYLAVEAIISTLKDEELSICSSAKNALVNIQKQLIKNTLPNIYYLNLDEIINRIYIFENQADYKTAIESLLNIYNQCRECIINNSTLHQKYKYLSTHLCSPNSFDNTLGKSRFLYQIWESLLDGIYKPETDIILEIQKQYQVYNLDICF